MCSPIRRIAVAVALLIVLTASAEEPEYTVRLAVPFQVGARRKVTITLTQVLEIETKKDDKPMTHTKENNRVELTGVIETVDVDRHGRETKLKLTVEKFVLITEDRPPDEVLKPGTEVNARVGLFGGPVYTLKDSAEMPKLADHILPRVIEMRTNSVTDNALYAPKEKQKVGATWPADQKLLLKSSRSADMKFDELKAVVKLAAIKKPAGKDCLDIRTEVTGASPGPGAKDMIPVQFTIQMALNYTIPADLSTGPVEERVETKMSETVKGKPGTANEGISKQGRSTDTRTVVTEYLKK